MITIIDPHPGAFQHPDQGSRIKDAHENPHRECHPDLDRDSESILIKDCDKDLPCYWTVLSSSKLPKSSNSQFSVKAPLQSIRMSSYFDLTVLLRFYFISSSEGTMLPNIYTT